MLEKISKLSAKIGKNLTLIQGSGGNTSIKENEKMCVKASGKWLADAEKENIFVSVNDSAIREAIKSGDNDPVSQYVHKEQNLRPSIETTLHALLMHKVVLHVHSVNVIAWAVRKDGKEQLRNRLHGLKWAWVDYKQPGLSLTNAVAKVIKNHPDILILANHGLVVGASSCEEAEKLLYEIELRLSNNYVDDSPNVDYEKLNTISATIPYIPSNSEDIHAIATNPKKLKIASQGIFYPDHVVFLGPELTIIQRKEQTNSIIENYKQRFGSMPIALYVENAGVLVLKDIKPGAGAMLFALAYVLMRLDLSLEYNYLTNHEVFQLLNWEAEKYRQTITR